MVIWAERPVEVSHPDKLLWPDAGVRKRDYLEYLAKMAPFMLPHLAERALTIIRWPDGVEGPYFYQKAAPSHTPDWIRRTRIWSPDRQAFFHAIVVDSAAALLWLGNLAALELHVGFSRVNTPDVPDVVALDLDPSVPDFEPVREVALALRKLFDELGIPSLPKLSGATGIQVLFRTQPVATYEAWRPFTRMVAAYLARRMPRWVTLERRKHLRGDKVYVDAPQHGKNRTLIAPYSARATSLATVAVPVTWEELAQGVTPDQFTLATVPERVLRLGDLLASLPPVDPKPIVTFFQSSAVRR
ncbi:DNA polymerase domain-containing protein [Alicyclobacillus cellulosilyticus]|uniref:DNA polymerase domain-containing protein n=1 Tax=Alicyclobacillus cellulosilyticus TaxID=1003997 RepID=A0A917NLX0_9BACL|nr:non-homologous end-joining DNA ligase [Alicyclobacillus cellulosilyticus]GGJ10581.1 DNA polymerase domain-containing protein [Alicyclobacillus cellulosilyticus]